jgi:hypothetical protein
MARTPKLTSEVHAKIIQVLHSGNYRQTAAVMAGIAFETFRRWMVRGKRETKGIYHVFRAAVIKAEEEAVVRNTAHIQLAAQTSWQAAAWWNERKFPERWGLFRGEMKKMADVIAQQAEQIRALQERAAQDAAPHRQSLNGTGNGAANGHGAGHP